MTDEPRIITLQDRLTFWAGISADDDIDFITACAVRIPLIVKDDTVEPEE